MTQDIFLKLTSIQGESSDASHPNEIEVLEWDWSVSQPSMMHRGSGGGAGKCTVHHLKWLIRELEETLDVSSQEIYRHPEIARKNPSEARTAEW